MFPFNTNVGNSPGTTPELSMLIGRLMSQSGQADAFRQLVQRDVAQPQNNLSAFPPLSLREGLIQQNDRSRGMNHNPQASSIDASQINMNGYQSANYLPLNNNSTNFQIQPPPNQNAHHSQSFQNNTQQNPDESGSTAYYLNQLLHSLARERKAREAERMALTEVRRMRENQRMAKQVELEIVQRLVREGKWAQLAAIIELQRASLPYTEGVAMSETPKVEASAAMIENMLRQSLDSLAVMERGSSNVKKAHSIPSSLESTPTMSSTPIIRGNSVIELEGKLQQPTTDQEGVTILMGINQRHSQQSFTKLNPPTPQYSPTVLGSLPPAPPGGPETPAPGSRSIDVQMATILPEVLNQEPKQPLTAETNPYPSPVPIIQKSASDLFAEKCESCKRVLKSEVAIQDITDESGCQRSNRGGVLGGPMCKNCSERYAYCPLCRQYRPLDVFSVSSILQMSEVKRSGAQANGAQYPPCNLLHHFWSDRTAPQPLPKPRPPFRYVVYDAPKLCIELDSSGVPVLDHCRELFYETAVGLFAEASVMERQPNFGRFSSLERIRERCHDVWQETVRDLRSGTAFKTSKRFAALALVGGDSEPGQEVDESSPNFGSDVEMTDAAPLIGADLGVQLGSFDFGWPSLEEDGSHKSRQASPRYAAMMTCQWAKAEGSLFIANVLTGTAPDGCLTWRLLRAIIRKVIENAQEEGHSPPVLAWMMVRQVTDRLADMARRLNFVTLEEAVPKWEASGWFDGRGNRQVALQYVKKQFRCVSKRITGSDFLCYVTDVESITSPCGKQDGQQHDESKPAAQTI
ncbi:hypothetical protein BJ742DRAFT_784855 [Cladochytrium replicatum]|nr:hypothetical protein BJ742DRAFT_784855 [Cladochytrium replicatum]